MTFIKFRRRSRPQTIRNQPFVIGIALIAAASCTAVLAFEIPFCRHGMFGRTTSSASYLRRNLEYCKVNRGTALNYKNLPDDQPTSTGINESIRTPTKRTKLKPSKRKSRKVHDKKPATREELAHHVQSAFSESLGDILLMDSDDMNDADDFTKNLQRHPSLVLNADYQPLRMLPLSIWSWQDTVKAVLGGKAVVVEVYPDVVVRAVSINMPVPSVIALREYAPTGKAKPAFTRRNVFLRDGYKCQYCSELFRTSELSLDHVEPRCYGGKLTWENTVTSCRKCNGRKGCLRPTQLHTVGMTLKTTPRCPSLYELAAEANKFVPRRVHPTWAPFLGLDVEVDDKDGQSSTRNGSSLPRL